MTQESTKSGVHKFWRNLGATSKFKMPGHDMQHVPHREFTNISYYGTKRSHQGDPVPSICASVYESWV